MTEASTAAPAGQPAPTAHDWRPARFMVIVAHPDDAEFGPAATAARWIDAGSVGWLVCCTSGDQGGEDPDLDPLALAATREAEQRAAAEIVGYAGVSFLHQPDGALANDLPLRELLVREIRTVPARRGPDPGSRGRRLPRRRDQPHRSPGGRHRRGRRGLPGGPQPDGLPVAGPRRARPPIASAASTCSGPTAPNAWIDVSATLGRKIDALRAHASQIKDRDGLATRIASWARGDGARIGVEAAEAFRLASSTTTRTRRPVPS